MKSYIQIISKAMEEQNVSIEELARVSKVKEKDMHAFLSGKQDVPLEEFARIVKHLRLDVNEVLGIRVPSKHSFMIITDEMEQHVNAIARSIRKKDRKKFERAVEYLAECFGDKWGKKKKKEKSPD